MQPVGRGSSLATFNGSVGSKEVGYVHCVTDPNRRNCLERVYYHSDGGVKVSYRG